jgi:hypothetical protein
MRWRSVIVSFFVAAMATTPETLAVVRGPTKQLIDA